MWKSMCTGSDAPGGQERAESLLPLRMKKIHTSCRNWKNFLARRSNAFTRTNICSSQFPKYTRDLRLKNEKEKNFTGEKIRREEDRDNSYVFYQQPVIDSPEAISKMPCRLPF